MDKDYIPSKKYTKQQMDYLDIPYKFRDYCIDNYVQYHQCLRQHVPLVENNLVYYLPFSQYYTSCKSLRSQWFNCQDYRQKELFDQLKVIFQNQKKQI